HPLLCLGWDALHPDSALGLLALQRLAARPSAMAQPWIVAGGEAELWLLAALIPPLTGARTGEGGVLFGGADMGAFAATLNTVAPPNRHRPQRHLLPGMAWMLAPTTLPGAARSELEFLPFALAPDLFAPQAAPETDAHGANLEPWAALLLLVGLILGVLFF
ncbi:MAG: hypothetical protein D6790_17035, partial [Caldilineae bacterium]